MAPAVSYQKPLIGTSWKMNKTNREAIAYLTRLQERVKTIAASVFILPPFSVLSDACKFLQHSGSNIIIGSQNVHWDDYGAFTGEVSAPMLKEIGCQFVEINHQERRRWFGETNETANWKIHAVLRHGMFPIICLGDEKREEWPLTEAFLRYQLLQLLTGIGPEVATNLILAYEPLWAIGAAEAAPTIHIAQVHSLLRQLLAEKYGETIANAIPLLYGGSVSRKNAAELSTLPNVDGLFIGRAALEADGLADLLEMALTSQQQSHSLC
ncbi:hypothetical protein P22_2139 [Propionispora sp. 2/2-37]|uniref:triose-phosphate isomerase family protein n=1 Tax=Propionispora sp. 2/2-37 TaxID=1677858 RepID=UPI0006BB9155|nr:triose-phosphate isomerase [Propionispora sp. 2/2-37]CUH96051.1 hypothetical protein P22_2139 [Propionispora sp. 2/2-37]